MTHHLPCMCTHLCTYRANILFPLKIVTGAEETHRKIEEILGCMDMVCASPELERAMCDCIERAKSVGTYDGAYKVVKLALGESL